MRTIPHQIEVVPAPVPGGERLSSHHVPPRYHVGNIFKRLHNFLGGAPTSLDWSWTSWLGQRSPSP